MEESQETVVVESLVGVLGFPWEGDSNEGGKTFLLQMSAAETRGLSPWPSGLLVTGDPTGSRFLRAAHRETGSEATTRKGRSANTAALRGELLEVFLLPGVHCGRNRGEKHHREERV